MVAKAIARLANTPPDVVVATGDLAQTGLDSEFRAVEDLLAPLTRKGIPIIIADGNHDHYGAASRSSWIALEDKLSLHLTPDRFGIYRFPALEILALDQGTVSPPFFSYGRVDGAALVKAYEGWGGPPGGVTRVVCGHYPIIGNKGSTPKFFYGLRGWPELLGFLREVRASAYLCGHHHRRFMAELGDGVVQYSAPSLSSDGRVNMFECLNGEFEFIKTG